MGLIYKRRKLTVGLSLQTALKMETKKMAWTAVTLELRGIVCLLRVMGWHKRNMRE